ncbi:hypothetical protein ISF_07279 [Cordyceps fumosorosea ARSEF 2679]|uniref:Uncharacterized protein n=1 Tax=Cordyceps fumosorosea (strain ARSEF 2679) TaxID=1081104 RepID=A0A167PKW2_CORFA|nr:hypothetical protein ISF_07279 [Cordyceps fumosorosea ARSEF 2679]OAA56763.1 hypothetical protein ISF_07279 [Cordyceps fumosorosea ARSEF 2679]
MKLFLPILALVGLVTTSPLAERGPSIFVGYRTVSAAQAELYRKAGNTLVYTGSQSSDQLGPGVYISPNFGDWPGSPDGWVCAILADALLWNPVNKAWVPEFWNGKPLWWKKNEANMVAYLKNIGGSNFVMTNTIRLSIIDGFRLLQLLIPGNMVENRKILNTRTQCAAKTDKKGIEAIKAYGSVDWSKWPNVKGQPQTP